MSASNMELVAWNQPILSIYETSGHLNICVKTRELIREVECMLVYHRPLGILYVFHHEFTCIYSETPLFHNIAENIIVRHVPSPLSCAATVHEYPHQ